jgi:hypothetical protein
MSKMGQWVFEMQEDAYDMTLSEFIRKYGAANASVWHEVDQSIENERDYMEMDDGV